MPHLRRRTGLAVRAIPLLIAAGAVCSTGASDGAANRAGLVGYGSSTSDERPASGVVLAPDAGNASTRSVATSFSISGSVTGLYPGAARPLVLTVTNPFPFAITVTSIKSKISNASTLCAATYLTVSSFSGRVGLPAHQTAHVSVVASMLHSAPDACQGANFPLHYAGLATKS
jgi:hypothetical protein